MTYLNGIKTSIERLKCPEQRVCLGWLSVKLQWNVKQHWHPNYTEIFISRKSAKTRITESFFPNWKWHPYYFPWNGVFVNVAKAVYGGLQNIVPQARLGDCMLRQPSNIFQKLPWLNIQNLHFSESSMDAISYSRKSFREPSLMSLKYKNSESGAVSLAQWYRYQ